MNMKELTIFEMEQIAAGTEDNLFTRIAAAALNGAASGFAMGWDSTLAIVEKSFNNMFDGQFVPWAQ